MVNVPDGTNVQMVFTSDKFFFFCHIFLVG